jgi:hypothetical protein
VINMPETPEIDEQFGRRGMDELYGRLIAADGCRDTDAGPLARVAWDLYAQLGTVTADLETCRAHLHGKPLDTAA